MTTSAQKIKSAFWSGKIASGSNIMSTGDKVFSYGTCILQRLPSGKTIGNVTKYSSTTSRHQSGVDVRSADLLVDKVPMGTQDLSGFKTVAPISGVFAKKELI